MQAERTDWATAAMMAESVSSRAATAPTGPQQRGSLAGLELNCPRLGHSGHDGREERVSSRTGTAPTGAQRGYLRAATTQTGPVLAWQRVSSRGGSAPTGPQRPQQRGSLAELELPPIAPTGLQQRGFLAGLELPHSGHNGR